MAIVAPLHQQTSLQSSYCDPLLDDAPSPVSKEKEDLVARHRKYLREGRPYLIPDRHASVSYYVRIGDPSCKKKFLHNIYFKDNLFTLDDKNFRSVDDPANAPFLEILKQKKCPDEFKEVDGLHLICAFRAGDKEGVSVFRKKPRKNYFGPKYDTWDDGKSEKAEESKDE